MNDMIFKHRKIIVFLIIFALMLSDGRIYSLKNTSGTVTYAADPTATSTSTPTPVTGATVTPTSGAANDTYYMVVNANEIANGSSIEVTAGSLDISVTNKENAVPASAAITWSDYDSNVINVVQSTSNKYKVTVSAVGPGYAQLEAIVNYNGYDYKVYCQLHVGLGLETSSQSAQINHYTADKYGILNNLLYSDTAQSVTLQLSGQDGTFSHYLLMLNHVQYASGTNSLSTGTSLLTSTPELTWTSSNPDVASVDSQGLVTAVGSGYCQITVETTTVSESNKTESLVIPVIVAPSAYLVGGSASYSSSFTTKASSVYLTYMTNAVAASNLTWTLHKDAQDGDVLDIDSNEYMSVAISKISGTVTLTNVKAGVYYLIGRPSSGYSETNSSVKKVVIQIIMPVIIDTGRVVMNVGDTYNLSDNMNVYGSNVYSMTVQSEDGTASEIASVSNGVLSALTEGTGYIVLTYQNSSGVFSGLTDSSDYTGTIKIPITVIDGVSLNYTTASIYVGGTMQLHLTTSNNAAAITWTSSDSSVAEVTSDGLVTGKAAGTVTITATQLIGGVTKKATCKIKVIAAVTSITLSPSSKNISIGDNLTINATVKPSLNDVSLSWITSDASVVSIATAGNLSCTVTGVAGGTAVITAINTDNVVVGSCKVTVYQAITGITLSETAVTTPLSTGYFRLYATIAPTAASEQTIVWSSSDESVAAVDQTGKVTLKKAGTTSIIVTAKADSTITAKCTVTVTKSVTGLTLDTTSYSMYVKDTYRLTYTITPTDAANTAVTFSSTNASVCTVDKAGLVTAKGVGSCAVIVKTTDGGYMGTCIFTVQQKATAIKLDVSKLSLDVGDYYSLVTTLTPADSTDTSITYESTDTSVCTVSAAGKVVAVSAGLAVIIAKTAGGATASCAITVIQGVEGVELSSAEETLVIGDDVELTATVSPDDCDDDSVKWDSTDSSIASVDSEGDVTGVGEGVAIITATTNDGGYSAYCVIIVEAPEPSSVPVTDIKLNKTYYKLGINKTYTLTANVTPSDATDATVTWSSSNKKIATVNEKGKVKGIKAGTVTIRCTANDGSGVYAECSIRVVHLVSSITLNPDSVKLVVGDVKTIKATVKPANATYKTPIWTSSDESVAIVKKGKITALKAGSCIITARANDTGKVSDTCYVTVIDPITAKSITIVDAASGLIMTPGEKKAAEFSVTPVNNTDTFSWSSSNTVVASVSQKGIITAKTMGNATITMLASSGATATISVYVVGLSKTNVTLQQYSATIISLKVYGANQDSLTVEWQSSNEDVAEVSNGKITGRGIGTATVYAVVNGHYLPCTVTVTKIKDYS